MKHFLLATAVAVLIGSISTPATSATYTAVVSQLQPNHETMDCIFFRLSGVTDISPASPGDWFAIPRNSDGAMETFAVLLASRTKANMPVTVYTTSAMACGYAQAVSVIM
ncbi:hypothetical protein GCM10011487_05910 [Steroidobacter agaridevorans]|uniref:Uncharacterized protein n=1 Tax=Steroidobacter agaridevorans TaxID=2695856 RepID=A0A829Y6F9_9GAMM|nr:hypothetical protein [Steroidobacter agaridevorans]GFE78591.1 hypothetical protein GCM10011487_05910 [Steroidobacter agaridevorans]GFE89476.1 hypothetical protein GCM10011488_44300 [Steroidobacter agaridevorans]